MTSIENPLVVDVAGGDTYTSFKFKHGKKLYDKDFSKIINGVNIPSLKEIQKLAPYNINDRNEILLNIDDNRQLLTKKREEKKLDRYVDIVIPRNFQKIHKSYFKKSNKKKSNKRKIPNHIIFKRIKPDDPQFEGGVDCYLELA